MAIKLSDNDRETLLTNIERTLYKKSYFEFFNRCVRELEPSVDWHIGWYHKYLADILQKEAERISAGLPKTTDYCISIPPRSSKSLLFNSCFVAWTWLFYPHLKFMRISYADELSATLSYQTKLIFQLPFYLRLNNSFKLRDDENTKTKYSNDRMGSSYAAGMSASLTGFGADIILVDDAAKASEIGELKRKTVIDTYKNTIYNRLNNPKVGVRFIIGQRIHNQDLIGYLLEHHADNYTSINFPATISDLIRPIECQQYYNMGLLLPELFDIKVLEEYRKALGTYGYSAQYEMQPVPVGGGLLKYDWFETIQWQDDFSKLTWHLVIDSAYGRKSGDASAVLVCAKWNNCLLIKRSYQLFLEFPELVQTIKSIHLEHCNSQSKVFLEPKASGISILQALKRETKFNVIETKTDKNKVTRDDKVTRTHAISPIVESHRVFCVDGSYLTNFLDEVCNFPLAQYDDQLDTLVYGIEEILNKNITVNYINQTNINARHINPRRH